MTAKIVPKKPIIAPNGTRTIVFGEDGVSGGVAYSKTLKVSGWKPAARL